MLGIASIGIISIGAFNKNLSLPNLIKANDGYTLTLDSSNHLETEDGGNTYYSHTSPLNNEVYFESQF